MRVSQRIVFPFVAMMCLSTPRSTVGQAAPIDSTKVALIRQLLQVTRPAEMAATAMKAGIPAQRAANPQIPAEFWDEFTTRAQRETPRLVEMLVPIYAAHFTTEQLRQLVAFFSSPLGRHLAEVQPAIALESMQAGQRWGAQLGAEIGQDLARRGARIPRP